MDSKEQLFDKIEDYLRGKFSLEEIEAFEREIAHDNSLAEEVKKHRFERMGLEFLLEQDLRDKMEVWKTEEPPRSGWNFRWLQWIFMFIVAASIGLFFYLNNRSDLTIKEESATRNQAPVQNEPGNSETRLPVTPQKPVAETKGEDKSTNRRTNASDKPDTEYIALAEALYTLPEQFGSKLKGGNDTEERSILDAGINAFLKGAYKDAIQKLNAIQPDDGAAFYEFARELLAHAYFKEKQYPLASDIFQRIVNTNYPPAIHDRAEWYLLLSLLPDYDNNRQVVDQLIQKMINPGSYHNYAESALNLQKQMEELSDE